MKIEVLSAFISGAALAENGTFDEVQKATVSTIASELKLDAASLFAAIDKEIAKQQKLSAEEFDAYFAELAEEISAEEALIIFEICIEIVLSDGILCKDEAILLLSFGEVLKIEGANLILMIAHMVRETPELEIKLEEK